MRYAVHPGSGPVEIISEGPNGLVVCRIMINDVVLMTRPETLRPLIGPECVAKVNKILKARGDVKRASYQKKTRDRVEKLNSGSIYNWAEIVRDLRSESTYKALNFTDRQLMAKAAGLMELELSLVTKEIK